MKIIVVVMSKKEPMFDCHFNVATGFELSDYESPPLTTRAGIPPYHSI